MKEAKFKPNEPRLIITKKSGRGAVNPVYYTVDDCQLRHKHDDGYRIEMNEPGKEGEVIRFGIKQLHYGDVESKITLTWKQFENHAVDTVAKLPFGYDLNPMHYYPPAYWEKMTDKQKRIHKILFRLSDEEAQIEVDQWVAQMVNAV